MKKTFPGSAPSHTRPRAFLLVAALAVPAALAAWQTGAGSANGPVPRVTVLSSRADMVTGGDALVLVEVPASARVESLTMTLNGRDVSQLFKADPRNPGVVGLVSGFIGGPNILTASVGGRAAASTITNYPVAGPVFSGPHERPFVCETARFELRSGGTLGPALDADCTIETRVEYVYRSVAGGALEPLTDSTKRPPDLARMVTLLGVKAPYVVRIETGTINRAIYQIAMPHDPLEEPSPDYGTRSRAWNGRLIYTFGGGCAGGWFRQGRSTGGVEDDVMLRQGYAVASASLNVFGNNCNDLLAAESMMMVKERFIERFGRPLFTLGWGCSGGSYQAHQIADNYPGLLDGIVVGCSFPDVGHASISVHSFGARLMHQYFQSTAERWTTEQVVAASGLPNHDSLTVQGTRPDRISPRGVCDPAIPHALLYDPVNNRRGARCTVYDHTVNVYGRDSSTGFARRFLDNVGVQYGLLALNVGTMTTAQFLDLNEKIGGIDIDGNFIPQRTIGDPSALRIAYETGRILSGGGGLAATPMIDYRGYADFDKGDPHMRFHSFSTRERLRAANGHADNHVMIVEDGATYGLFSTRSPALTRALNQMDRWLTSLGADRSGDSPALKVVRAKPVDLVDACFDGQGRKIVETQRYGAGACHDLYPSHATPYLVAGMPLANNVVKCQLKPIAFADYKVAFTAAESDRLRRIFPGGVCDYSRPGVEQRLLRGTWLSFGPSTTNLVEGS